MEADNVRAWAEQVTIPTYPVGKADKNPMFLEKRVYQGSSGVVYPHAVIDRISDEKEDREYTAVFLENRYLKIMLLPEIGGRVQMALDKTNGYHFVYYNQVIKPALVGLAGPWISGGIEFNWPQHHRPSTFMPVDWRIDENPDGSRTVWCAEIERMFHTRGVHGFTLHPARAYLEIHAQLYNRTAEPQTFLWWANPAVHVNDDYQSVFPPDVTAVMDHGKRDVSTFPIATGTYYKVNYAPGTDISRYKNIPVPTSYMAYHSDFDFVGNYDHGKRAGMMHIANHHVVPGKKQWTWGNSDFGKAWDRQLTDTDGPYIELMCGAYTDNQPDFSWLMPGEEKRFTQVFMPYKEIGPASNANTEAVVHLETEGSHVQLGVYVTRPRSATIRLEHHSVVVMERTLDLDPTHTLNEKLLVKGLKQPHHLTLRVLEGDQELISFSPLAPAPSEIPSPASPARTPEEIQSNEELFLNGQHLEQYRHATYAPEPYYKEALRRDPLDSRCNNALGLLLYRRGKFSEAEGYFRTAVKSLTCRNPNPYDGEAYYNLGLSLKMQGRWQEAFDAFYKAVWNAAWQDPAYFELGRLACRAGRSEDALDLLQRSLHRNWLNHRARHLRAAILRRLGREMEALAEVQRALELDRLEPGALWEYKLLAGGVSFENLIKADPNTYLELALDYAQAGLFADALDILRLTPEGGPQAAYFAAWILSLAGRADEAQAELASAAALNPDYCFPNHLESVLAFESAMRLNPQDARAPYYLGNFWYAHRRYEEAIQCWETAAALDPAFPTTWRNLGLAYYNKRGDSALALKALARAFTLNPSDARVLFELDQLHKKLNDTPGKRLKHLEQYPALVNGRDDLLLEKITLLNLHGRAQEALDILLAHNFHPWEGGEGKSTGQYVLSLVELARQALANGQHQRALTWLEMAQTFPNNLGEGKLAGAQENHIFYYLGLAYAGLGENEKSRQCLEKASSGLSEPTSAMFYNDQPPDMIFYQGLAREALGQRAEAELIFRKLIDYGIQHLNDQVTMDYFAVSLPDFLVFDEDLNLRNQMHCHYMMGLGYLGLKDISAALDQFGEVLAVDANHTGIIIHARLT
jgi:tetratricopeptide (TPR) repeat protein